MGDEMLYWGLGLLAASILLVIIEVFVPSGGLISLLATGCAIAGVYCLFQYSTTWGIAGILALIVLGPSAFAFALKVWPNTPIGKKMLGERPPELVEAEHLESLRQREQLAALIGQEATVRTDLRPVGVIELNGQRHPALAETAYIKAGSRVKVTAIDGTQIKVRPLT